MLFNTMKQKQIGGSKRQIIQVSFRYCKEQLNNYH